VDRVAIAGGGFACNPNQVNSCNNYSQYCAGTTCTACTPFGMYNCDGISTCESNKPCGGGPACTSGTWRPTDTQTTVSLRGIWGETADALIVVGSRSKVFETDGFGFTEMAKALDVPEATLQAVWGAGQQVFAVGDGGVILTSTGGGPWSRMTSNTTVDLLDVWGSAANDVFAVGPAIILHYDGSGWSAETPPGSPSLKGVSGTGPSEVYVVGSGVILRYDGSQWLPETIAGGTGSIGQLEAVWAHSADSVFAVGRGGIILRRSGGAWTQVYSTGGTTGGDFNAVWGTDDKDVWVAGNDASLLRYDGLQWRELGSTSGTTAAFHDGWGGTAMQFSCGF